MAEKKVVDVKPEATVEVKDEGFKFGTIATVSIITVKDNRQYKFDMPVGASLYECKEACLYDAQVIDKMIEDAETKEKEEKAKKEAEKKEEIVDTK